MYGFKVSVCQLQFSDVALWKISCRNSIHSEQGFLQGIATRRWIMNKKRKPQFSMPEKTCWHLYSLQNLHAEKFIKVVGKILKKDYLLIK
jgi:hypothetical protein